MGLGTGKTYSGSRIQGSKRPRIRIRNTIHSTALYSQFGPSLVPLYCVLEEYSFCKCWNLGLLLMSSNNSSFASLSSVNKGHFSFCEKIYSMREGLPCVAGGKDNLWLQLHTLYSQFGLLCQVHLRTVPVPLHLMYLTRTLCTGIPGMLYLIKKFLCICLSTL